MNENPVFVLLMIGVGVYVTWLWRQDLLSHRAGPQAGTGPGPMLPGATPAPARAIWLAAAGALLIVAGETWGELALGLADEQSRITVLFGCYTLAAAIIEEIIFRGYVVVENRGKGALWWGVLGASLLFAAIHPFLWEIDDGFRFTFTPKGWFSFGAVFVASLWFYTCRFATWNPHRSLLPCFAAHLAKNLAVFAIKAAQGFVSGWW